MDQRPLQGPDCTNVHSYLSSIHNWAGQSYCCARMDASLASSASNDMELIGVAPRRSTNTSRNIGMTSPNAKAGAIVPQRQLASNLLAMACIALLSMVSPIRSDSSANSCAASD